MKAHADAVKAKFVEAGMFVKEGSSLNLSPQKMTDKIKRQISNLMDLTI